MNQSNMYGFLTPMHLLTKNWLHIKRGEQLIFNASHELNDLLLAGAILALCCSCILNFLSCRLPFQFFFNWASEASPTLGYSIKILRDIYYVGRYVCRVPQCIGRIKWPMRML